ncbi:MAG: copper homeostasis protein CutC, partial [Arcanobacterium sp.]|nr:copper homeostasis protein CutC [Arcanobacterium sp.]
MLEVIAITVDDAREALRGGADRIELVGTMNDDGLSPTLDTIKEIQDEVGIPIRAMLRTEADFATTELERLLELAHSFSELQVDGVVLGYLDKGQV